MTESFITIRKDINFYFQKPKMKPKKYYMTVSH